MDKTLEYESPYGVAACILQVLKEPQQYTCEWGTPLWYQATKISDTQVIITFQGGQFRKMMRTQYQMEFLPLDSRTRIVLRFQNELFGLPPMTQPGDIDLCMKQKLNAVRI